MISIMVEPHDRDDLYVQGQIVDGHWEGSLELAQQLLAVTPLQPWKMHVLHYQDTRYGFIGHDIDSRCDYCVEEDEGALVHEYREEPFLQRNLMDIKDRIAQAEQQGLPADSFLVFDGDVELATRYKLVPIENDEAK